MGLNRLKCLIWKFPQNENISENVDALKVALDSKDLNSLNGKKPFFTSNINYIIIMVIRIRFKLLNEEGIELSSVLYLKYAQTFLITLVSEIKSILICFNVIMNDSTILFVEYCRFVCDALLNEPTVCSLFIVISGRIFYVIIIIVIKSTISKS